MLARLWRNYWAGLWIILAAPVVAGLCFLTARALAEIDPNTIGVVGLPLFFGGLGLGGVLVVAGLAVWAYRFHTEEP
jgi:hypothetical protein